MFVVKLAAVLNERCSLTAPSFCGLKRLERKHRLQAQDGVGEKHPDQAEEQHGDGVLLPVVLLLRIDADQLVSQSLQWLEDGIEEGLAIRVQNLAKVEAERLGDRQQDADVENELNPT